jgi:hypothetical protein
MSNTLDFTNRVINLIIFGKNNNVPTKFLGVVFLKYGVKFHDKNSGAQTDHENKTIELPRLLIDRLQTLAFDGNDDEARAIGLLYHEATHAYIRLKLEAGDREVTAIMDSAQAHYSGGKFGDGTAITDPDRVAHEAMAYYVHWRMLHWWQAKDFQPVIGLIRAVAGKDSDMARYTDLAIKNYETQMARRNFGHQNGGSHTTTLMPERMSKYCDREILENKIGDKYPG